MGSDSGGAMQGRSRGRRWRVRLGAGILKFLWFQGFKPKDFEIQTKDKSSIFEFNSRLSKRDLNLFKDQEFDKGDLSRNRK
jgi:hypothetical protein